MKSNPRSGRPAFTLIELMAVITIIVILAALVIGSLGFVQDKQARSKAKVQIELLSKGLEDYKLDNGTYPPTANSTDGKGYSDDLFTALFFDSDKDGTGPPSDTDQKIYIADLDPTAGKQGWTVAPASATSTILDPWGLEYRYRTAVNASGTANSSTQNPDFDLWSVGKDGSSTTTLTDRVNRDDIRNF